MSLLAKILCVCGLGVAAGCSESHDPRGARYPVTGTVTLDGEPLSGAQIVFLCEGKNGAMNAVGTIADGSFSLSEIDGPLAGTWRVKIVAQMIDLDEFEAARDRDVNKEVDTNVVVIPHRYNTNSELIAEIKSEGENKLDYQLESPKAQ